MNIQKELNRISSLEAEIKEIREKLENAPEHRTPEAADVYTSHIDELIIKTTDGRWIWESMVLSNFNDKHIINNESFIYLGKFSEVFVKISDVRDALSIVDKDGDDTIGLLQSFDCNQWGAAQTAEALRKLNIIK